MTTAQLEKLEKNVQYLMDRTEIQDKINLYALGQDHHQPGAENKNVLEEWSQIFTEDVEIDCTDNARKIFNLKEYTELMRGKDLKGGGLETPFNIWAHLEHPVTVEINGDTASSVSLHIHTHETKDRKTNIFAVGYWYDSWIRTGLGWRIKLRRIKQLYFHSFPLIETAELMGIEIDQ